MRAGGVRPGQGLTMISEMGSSGEDLGIYANITVNKSTSLPRTAIQKSASSASSRTPSFASSSGAPPVPAHGVERGERAAPKPRFPTFTGSFYSYFVELVHYLFFPIFTNSLVIQRD